jgi:hypothetical protein
MTSMPKQLVWAAGLLLALVAGIGFWLGLSGSRPSGADDSGAGPLASVSSARNAVAEATAPSLDEAAVRRIVQEELHGSKAAAPAVKKPSESSAPAAAPSSSAHAASSTPAAAPAAAPAPAPSPPPPPPQSSAPPILY